jgi:hypothetical protein
MAGEKTTLTIQPWMKFVAGIIMAYVPVLIGGYITFHDMGRDIASQKAEITSMKAQLVTMREKSHADDLVQTKVSTDLEYIRATMDRVEKTMDRLASQ